MDTDSPAPDPANDAASTTETRRRRSLLGLPARLAGLTVLITTLCVFGILAFADSRMQQAASQQRTTDAVSAARSIASDVSESDFQSSNDELTKLLDERLSNMRANDPALKGIALYAIDDAGRPTRVHGIGTATDATSEQTLRRAARTGEEQATANSTGANVAWPVAFSDGDVGGVVVLAHTSQATGALQSSRTRLLLGGVVGASLLSMLLLLLLRRELFRPLEEMRRVMTQIRKGAKGVRIGWNRGDELGLVADEFDAMVSELEDAQAELAKYVNRDPLTGLLTRDAFTDRLAGELTRARREGYSITLLAIDVDDLSEINRTHDTDAGDQVLASIGEVIGGSTRPTDACGRTGGDSFHVALVGADAAQAAVVIQRIRSEVAQRVGIGPERTRVTCGYGIAEYPTHAVDQIALERMAEAACAHAQRDGRDRALAFGAAGGYVDALTLVPEEERSGERPAGERELASTVHALARALDGIDPALGGGAHSQRVARYAAAVARDLDLTDAELRELRSAAVLHDVGKVAVPPSILRMPEEELDERQRGALRYHAWVSRTMIAGAGLQTVSDIVFHVPERWDGTGYPERARETAIPLASRILHAAELLDELTTDTLGRPAMGAFDAASQLKRRAGTELDPDIAVRLARLVREEGLLGRPDDASGQVADAA